MVPLVPPHWNHLWLMQIDTIWYEYCNTLKIMLHIRIYILYYVHSLVLGLDDTSNKALRLLQKHDVAIIANIASECYTY